MTKMKDSPHQLSYWMLPLHFNSISSAHLGLKFVKTWLRKGSAGQNTFHCQLVNRNFNSKSKKKNKIIYFSQNETLD